MEIPTLVTARLVLRPFRAEDLDPHAAMNADPAVMRYIGEVMDRQGAFKSLCAYVGHWHFCGYGPLAIEERATGRFVGRGGLVRSEPRRLVEVAYALAPAAWGKGYATEAAARALAYAHEVVGARGVVSRILEGNEASIRVAERLGARHVGDDPDERIRGVPVRVYAYPDP